MSLSPTADALPAALVDREQWVCWRTQERDGKPTKVPIIPGTTQFASTTDPETWRSFETAREGVTTTPVDGFGFVFTADDPLIGIDLDECRDPASSEPVAWAERIIADLDSYTEISPSGTGYHILVTGTLPDGRNRAGDIELYDRSRFFTVAGEHVTGRPETVCDRDETVATLHAEEIAATTSATSSNS
jgi:primase-polymerase (primpol)-like protein